MAIERVLRYMTGMAALAIAYITALRQFGCVFCGDRGVLVERVFLWFLASGAVYWLLDAGAQLLIEGGPRLAMMRTAKFWMKVAAAFLFWAVFLALVNWVFG